MTYHNNEPYHATGEYKVYDSLIVICIEFSSIQMPGEITIKNHTDYDLIYIAIGHHVYFYSIDRCDWTSSPMLYNIQAISPGHVIHWKYDMLKLTMFAQIENI